MPPALPTRTGAGRTDRGRGLAALAACTAFATVAAFAGAPGASAAASEPAAPIVELQAQATRQIPNDEMVVQLTAERAGTDMGVLNDEVLAALKSAIAAGKAVNGVAARLGSVTTLPEHDDRGQRTGWRVRGTLVLEGSDMQATGALAGRLASDLQIGAVQFRLTASRRAAEENRLLQEAAAAFRERAARTAAAFGFAGYELRQLSVQADAPETDRPMPIAMRAAGAPARSDVPDDGGEATVRITVSGSIQLRKP